MERLKLSSSTDELASSSEAGNGAAISGTTGRYLALFREGATTDATSVLAKTASMRVTSAAEFKDSAFNLQDLGDADALVLPELGVAVLSVEPRQLQILSQEAGETRPILAVEPERVVYALAAPGPILAEYAEVTPERRFEPAPGTALYLKGYKDAVDQLVGRLLDGSVTEFAQEELALAFPQAQVTWGLQGTRADVSRLTGKGIRVAILDTGLDLQHPDFAGRPITSQSFIPGQIVQDGNGHGTHVAGTALGPRVPAILPRYGIAHQAGVFIGKVLSNGGSGTDGGILAGINWALANKCSILSMSLGARVAPGQTFSPIFEAVGRRALTLGSLIIAAAGNDSNRPAGILRPVSHPANCPSILAVGAVDSALRIAFFSNRGLNPAGGRVDIAGPGVGVYSSWPMPRRNNTISGTSMATPHVAGIAALYAEQSPTARGANLWVRLTTTSRPLAIAAVDIGSGLVQAP